MQDEKVRINYIANFIKGFRSSRGLSLDELSKSSGVSRSMICQIEGAQTNPTISVLAKLATAMGVKLSELVDPTDRPKLYCRQSLENAKHKKLSKDGAFTCALMTEESSNRHIEVSSFRFSKKGKYQSAGHGPNATEYIFITQGEMNLETANEKLELREGDLVEFRANQPHLYEQTSKNLGGGLTIVFYGV